MSNKLAFLGGIVFTLITCAIWTKKMSPETRAKAMEFYN